MSVSASASIHQLRSIGFFGAKLSEKTSSYHVLIPHGLLLRISSVAVAVETITKAKEPTSLLVYMSNKVTEAVDENGNIEQENDKKLLNSKGSAAALLSGKEAFVVATLLTPYLQTSMDLYFIGGQEVIFQSKGPATLHITGYATTVDDANQLDDDEEDDEDYAEELLEGDEEEDDDEDEDDMDEDEELLAEDGMYDQGEQSAQEEHKANRKAPPASKSSGLAQRGGSIPSIMDELQRSGRGEGLQIEVIDEKDGESNDEKSDELVNAKSKVGLKRSPEAVLASTPAKKGKSESGLAAPVSSAKKPKVDPSASATTSASSYVHVATPAPFSKKAPSGPGTKAFEVKPAAQQQQQNATPKGKGVKCADADCKKTFDSEGAMKQHFQGKHAAKPNAAAAK